MKIFKDRITEFNNRYKETLVEKLSDKQSIITLEKVEGTILQKGNICKASDMNYYEQLAETILKQKNYDSTVSSPQNIERDSLVLIKDNTAYPTCSYFSDTEYIDDMPVLKRVLSNIGERKFEIFSTSDGLYLRELTNNIEITEDAIEINAGTFTDFVVLSNNDKNIYLLTTDGEITQAYVLTDTTATIINISELSNIKKIRNDGLNCLLETDTDTIFATFEITDKNNIVLNSQLSLGFLSSSCSISSISSNKQFVIYDNNYLVIEDNVASEAVNFTDKTVKISAIKSHGTGYIDIVFSDNSYTYLAQFSLNGGITYSKEVKLNTSSSFVDLYVVEDKVITILSDNENIKIYISTPEYSGFKTIKNYVKKQENNSLSILELNKYMFYIVFSDNEKNYLLKFIRSIEAETSNFSETHDINVGYYTSTKYITKMDDVYILFFVSNVSGERLCYVTFSVSDNDIVISDTHTLDLYTIPLEINQISDKNFLFFDTSNDRINLELKYFSNNAFNIVCQYSDLLEDKYVIKNSNYNRVVSVNDNEFIITTLVTDGTNNYLYLKHYKVENNNIECLFTHVIEQEDIDTPSLFDIYCISNSNDFVIFKDNKVAKLTLLNNTFTISDYSEIFETAGIVSQLRDKCYLVYNNSEFKFVTIEKTIKVSNPIPTVREYCSFGVLSDNYMIAASGYEYGQKCYCDILNIDSINEIINKEKTLEHKKEAVDFYKENNNTAIIHNKDFSLTLLHDINDTIYDKEYGLTLSKSYFDEIAEIQKVKIKNKVKIK